MKLRCWPGCLAYIVRPGSPNDGKLVTVVREWRGEGHVYGGPYAPSGEGYVWVIEGRGLVLPNGFYAGCPVPWHVARDQILRPITPPPGSETIVTDEPVKEVA